MMRDKFNVVLADPSYDPVLRNLFEFYLHDLAEWFNFEQLPEGNYTQSTEQYWGQGHDVYLLYAGKIPIGFGLVGPGDEWLPGSEVKDMDEFFVVRRHRRNGVGSEFASYLWHRHPGPWLVRVFQPNLPALPFWRKTISEFSDGRFEEGVLQKNGHPWAHFTFDSRDAQRIT